MSSVVVKSEPTKGHRHEIKAGKHTLIADMTAAQGGTETGPDPHELLLSALGACTSMTLQVFSKKRGWELTDVTVKLEESTQEVEGKKVFVITRDIEVHGNLTAEQVETLTSIADKCPIHKLLTGEKQIKTTLKAPAQQHA